MITFMKKTVLIAALAAAASLTGCRNSAETTSNPAAYITDRSKLEMIRSMKDLDNGGGRFYELDYTQDYKLDAMLAAQPTDAEGIVNFVAGELFDKVPQAIPEFNSGAACSAFAAPTPDGSTFLMGRNFDFCHKDPATGKEIPITAVLVRTSPEGGKKSISMVDSYWLGLKKGFYTDGVSDLSVMMAFPYALMDGINEDGLAVGVLHLGGEPTVQDAPGKRNIITTVAMRLLLDRASTVDQAIEMLKDYNLCQDSPAGGNYHFFIADASGDYAIVEYIYDNLDFSGRPNLMQVLNGNDTLRCVTNFYVSPDMARHPEGGLTDHGRWRYDKMRETLKLNAYKLTPEQGMQLLGDVATDVDINEPTSHTQWSSLYNLSSRTLDVAILKEYDKVSHFTF